MMNKRRRMGCMVLCILLTGTGVLRAQSELKSEFNLYGGSEYNIFKSPDAIYDNATGEYWGQDSLTITDFMADVGVDLDYLKEKKGKYALELGTDLWYRHYLNYDELSQTSLNVNGDYLRMLSQKIHLGAYYNFRWSDRVGTSVTGDLLMRSFKYLGNEGMIYLDLLPSEKVNMRLSSSYQYKTYYDENTLDPLDHGNFEASYSLLIAPSKAHDFGLNLSFLDRQYTYYHALNASGRYDRTHPLRHFRSYTATLDYNWRPLGGFRINPELEVKRRVDMFEQYYNYLSYGGGIRIRYMWDNFYMSVYGKYKQLSYDIREAFTTQADDPALVYGYVDLALTFKYSLSKNWEIYLSAKSDNRSSNSDLEYFRTRRGYKNYEALLGINYALPVMKGK